MIKVSKCLKCKNYIERDDMLDCCKAYPNGIPLEIFREEVDHTKPYKGDNGILFAPDERYMNKIGE